MMTTNEIVPQGHIKKQSDRKKKDREIEKVCTASYRVKIKGHGDKGTSPKIHHHHLKRKDKLGEATSR